MHKDLPTLLKATNRPIVFISPHLDDAILSAGELLSHLREKKTVQTLTLFTKPSFPPYPYATRSFMRKCGFSHADTFFKARREEDRRAFQFLGIKTEHLGFIDAAWRRKQHSFILTRLLGKFVPEFEFLYPLYYNTGESGIKRDDKILVKEIETKLRKIVPEDSFVLCPLSIGNHVDHAITRAICCKLFKRVIYWADFPYNTRWRTHKEFIQKHHLSEFSWSVNTVLKEKLIGFYKTQVPTLFQGGKITTVNETFFFDPKILT